MPPSAPTAAVACVSNDKDKVVRVGAVQACLASLFWMAADVISVFIVLFSKACCVYASHPDRAQVFFDKILDGAEGSGVVVKL